MSNAPGFGARRDHPDGPPFLYEAPEGRPQPDFEWMANNQLEGVYLPHHGEPAIDPADVWFVNRPVFTKWMADASRRARNRAIGWSIWGLVASGWLMFGIWRESTVSIASGALNVVAAIVVVIASLVEKRNPGRAAMEAVMKWSRDRNTLPTVKPF